MARQSADNPSYNKGSSPLPPSKATSYRANTSGRSNRFGTSTGGGGGGGGGKYDKLPPRPTKAEMKRADAAARSAADANGCFHLFNGVRVQLAAKPSAKAGIARLDRITAAAAAS